MRETWNQSLGLEDPLEEGMATHSSILAWRIPTDRGAWRSVVSPRVRHDWEIKRSRARCTDGQRWPSMYRVHWRLTVMGGRKCVKLVKREICATSKAFSCGVWSRYSPSLLCVDGNVDSAALKGPQILPVSQAPSWAPCHWAWRSKDPWSLDHGITKSDWASVSSPVKWSSNWGHLRPFYL